MWVCPKIGYIRCSRFGSSFFFWIFRKPPLRSAICCRPILWLRDAAMLLHVFVSGPFTFSQMCQCLIDKYTLTTHECVEEEQNMLHHGKGVARVFRYKHGTCYIMGSLLRYKHGTSYVMEHVTSHVRNTRLEMGDEFGWSFGENRQHFKGALTEQRTQKDENESARFATQNPRRV